MRKKDDADSNEATRKGATGENDGVHGGRAGNVVLPGRTPQGPTPQDGEEPTSENTVTPQRARAHNRTSQITKRGRYQIAKTRSRRAREHNDTGTKPANMELGPICKQEERK